MNISTDYENLIKLLMIGDSSVGKSNFIFRFTENNFSENHFATVGFDCKSQIVTLPNLKKVVKIQIWDTAGQERFMSINKQLFLRVQGIVLVYDITNYESFDRINIWIQSIREICDNIPLVLAGNKVDLSCNRVVTTAEGKSLADKYNLTFFETSAKDGTNIKETYINIAEKVLNNVKEGNNSYLSLKKDNKDNHNKKCC